jgi:hypothetical protein
MLTVGMLLKVKTKTLQDVFGEVVYEIVETGLPAREPHRKGINDWVKVVMLGGSGPSARKGIVIYDSEEDIQQWIKDGIVQILPASKKAEVVAYYEALESQKGVPTASSAGKGIET